jgi:hypothetical protein
MEIERRLVSYIALLIATAFFFFGRAHAASPDLPIASPTEACKDAPGGGKMVACKPDRPGS